MTDAAQLSHYRDLLHFCLDQIVKQGGSDLHVRPNEPPFMRQRGDLVAIPGSRELSVAEVEGMAEALTSRVPKRLEEFREAGESDLSYELPGVARFRVNMFRERGRPALTLRVIPQEVPVLGDLSLPPVIEQLACESHGLILVTGATGSGKTTTLAAMIDHMNRTFRKHILTIEDPIEIVHPNHESLISQREVGFDTGDFKQALRRALRQDPDVILIGEIRDEETMRTALAAAETGHLVLATLHTINTSETIARVLDLFPAEAEKQARAMLAGALKGIVSQRLARTVDGGRRAVVEVLINTRRIADCITNPEETAKLPEAVEQGEYYGMQSFDQALINLILDGVITEDEANHHVTSPQNFKLVLESAKAQRQVDEQKAAAEEQARLEAEAAAVAAQQQQVQYQAALPAYDPHAPVAAAPAPAPPPPPPPAQYPQAS